MTLPSRKELDRIESMTKRDIVSAFTKRGKDLDVSAMEPGENYNHFVRRMYAHAVSSIMMVSALTDKYVYQADDLVRRDLPDQEYLREGMMRHYHRYEERLTTLTNAPADFIEDLREKALQRTRRKADALCNSITKEAKECGIEHSECYAALTSFTNFVFVAEECYRVAERPLGKVLARYMPDYAKRALDILEMAGDYAKKLIAVVDPEGKRKGEFASKKEQDLALALIESIMSEEERSKALAYAEKGLRKQQKQQKKEQNQNRQDNGK